MALTKVSRHEGLDVRPDHIAAVSPLKDLSKKVLPNKKHPLVDETQITSLITEAQAVAIREYSKYIDTMTSLQPAQLQKMSALFDKQKKASMWSSISNWFCDLIGIDTGDEEDEIKQAEETSLASPENGKPGLPFAPSLKSPEDQAKKLAEMTQAMQEQSIKDLESDKKLQKELSQFGTHKLENLHFKLLLDLGLVQKAIKEQMSLDEQLDTHELVKKNKALKTHHFNLIDDIIESDKKSKTVKQLRVAATVLSVALFALSFYTGGASAILGAAIPASSFTGGGLKLLDANLNRNKGVKLGDLGIVKHKTKANSNKMDDKLSHMQQNDQELALLWKLMRRHLENFAKVRQQFTNVK